jgi:DNA gyrase/topoisomerase IV subunit A
MTDPEDPELLRCRAATRLRVVDGLIRAIELGWPLIQAVQESADRSDAASRLQKEPFGFDEVQAQHILDLTPHQRTRQGRERLEAEQRELNEVIGFR